MRAVLALTLALTAASAGAQTPARRPVAPAVPPAAVQAPPPTPPPPSAPQAPAHLTLSGLPQSFDAGPACRSQCTRTRLQCEAVADVCAPAWTACLRRCSAAK